MHCSLEFLLTLEILLITVNRLRLHTFIMSLQRPAHHCQACIDCRYAIEYNQQRPHHCHACHIPTGNAYYGPPATTVVQPQIQSLSAPPGYSVSAQQELSAQHVFQPQIQPPPAPPGYSVRVQQISVQQPRVQQQHLLQMLAPHLISHNIIDPNQFVTHWNYDAPGVW